MNTVYTTICPYCWQPVEIEIDTYATVLEYVQDCSVCCHPILFRITDQNGELCIEALRENE